jgi:TolA-binding protein
MKANDEKAAKNLEAARTAVESLKRDLDESILGLQGQVRNLNTQISSLKTTEEPLPTATQLFQQAYTDFNAGLYSVAVDEFKDFLRNFPNDPTRSPMALIYTGEALMFQKKYEPAIVEFDSVLSKFPSSDRKCLALYRKGQAHVALNKLSEATTVFNTVVKDCPGTQEATNAANDLKAMPKPGARGGKQ